MTTDAKLEDHAHQGRTSFLDLEMTEGPTDRDVQILIATLINDLPGVRGYFTRPGEFGFDNSGIGFYSQYRVVGRVPDLLEVASRYFERTEQETWDFAFRDCLTGEVHPLSYGPTQRTYTGSRDRFKTGDTGVYIEASNDLTDAQGAAIADLWADRVEEVLGDLKTEFEHRLRAWDVKVVVVTNT